MFGKSALPSDATSLEDAYRNAVSYSLLPPNMITRVLSSWEHSTPEMTSAGFVVQLRDNTYRYLSFSRTARQLQTLIEKADTEPVWLYSRANNWNRELDAFNAKVILFPTEHDSGWQKTPDGGNIEEPLVVGVTSNYPTGAAIGEVAAP